MKTILSCILLCSLGVIYAQQNAFEYPEGIYSNFDDFITGKPSLDISIEAKQGKNIMITTFRIKDGNGNKIKDAFAASDGENLYVSTNAMLGHLTNVEFDRPNATDKDYSLVLLANRDYLYLEVFFQSKSVKNWGLGKVYLSGILYNNTSGKFTILESMEDLQTALGRPVGNGDQRINGQNIDVARKAVLPLFNTDN
jgi:hypothetical protein